MSEQNALIPKRPWWRESSSVATHPAEMSAEVPAVTGSENELIGASSLRREAKRHREWSRGRTGDRDNEDAAGASRGYRRARYLHENEVETCARTGRM